MKRRIAKKKKVRDYTEELFWFHVSFCPEIPEETLNKQINGFIDKIKENNFLCYAVFTEKNWKGYIYPQTQRKKIDPIQRNNIQKYIQSLPNWIEIGMSPNLDSNHTPAKEFDAHYEGTSTDCKIMQKEQEECIPKRTTPMANKG